MSGRSEDGFTLIEVLLTAALVALLAAATGTLFLAGASPAVAAASRDVGAALAEARRTALAFDTATVVFAPQPAGGYSARVYERTPGDPAFRPRNGPGYESAVAIGETAAPLGAPGFALAIDRHGNVTGYAHFYAGDASPEAAACPSGGAFVLRLSRASQIARVSVPCALELSATAVASAAVPPVSATPAPLPPAACPSGALCVPAPPPAPPVPACPPADLPDPGNPGLCVPAATPPAQGVQSAAPPTAATPAPGATATPSAALCVAGAPDAAGFATCIVDDPVRATGAEITHANCGTRTPVTDPGPVFTVTLEVDRDGSPWGTYAVTMLTLKTPWLDLQAQPPARVCGLAFTLMFRIAGVAPLGGNARLSPAVDTGDPALSDDGVGALLAAPPGSAWGSDG